MKKVSVVGITLLLLMSFAMPVYAAPLKSAKTYTILVGAENVAQGVGIMSFFPGTLSIHVGDTVVWKANSHEIHTVTFLANQPMPDFLIPAPGGLASPLMINPLAGFPTPNQAGTYDGSSYLNSGILSTDPGQGTKFSLTFTKIGSFPYICIVHGMMMSGTINVVADSVRVKSPADVAEQSAHQVYMAIAKAYGLIGEAMSKVPGPVHNPDKTTSYTVLIGYAKDSADLMRFFPSKLTVHPGDTVNFMLSSTDDAPHTVTFLNGNPDLPLVVASPNPPNPPYLLINAQVLTPANPGVALNKTDLFNSGMLMPGGQSTYTLKIGNVSGSFVYQCILHDTSGMVGTLRVLSK